MARLGGARPGAGRKPGVANTKTRAIADAAAVSGLTPLEYLLSVMRDEDASPTMRLDAAKSAAPYMHPRLATETHRVEGALALSRVEVVIVPPPAVAP